MYINYMREGGKRLCFCSSQIRTVVAMAMSSFYKLIMIMEKVEIGNFIGDI